MGQEERGAAEKARHTPGPLHVAACKDHSIDDGYICVQVRKADGTPLDPTLADLRLHAAAPDLLAACEAVVSLLAVEGLKSPTVEVARAAVRKELHAAIAKAVGK